MSLADFFTDELDAIDQAIETYFEEKPHLGHPGFEALMESMKYSLNTGGKRFRPLLSVLTAKALGKPIQQAMPVALAVEFVHTYSLIHDDLPCMDNDDERRGQPTNHKKYGEAMALLAGDSLLTESFFLLADRYKQTPHVATEVIWLLTEAAGAVGMVGGQAMDIQAPEEGQSADHMDWIHQMKTGALIRASVEAAAVACGATPHEREKMRQFAEHLGYAFQLADDIDDFDPANPEPTSMTNLLGLEGTREKLASVTELALKTIERFNAKDLEKITRFNLQRV